MEQCPLCGRHDTIIEYFEDMLFHYCPVYDRCVTPEEVDEYLSNHLTNHSQPVKIEQTTEEV